MSANRHARWADAARSCAVEMLEDRRLFAALHVDPEVGTSGEIGGSATLEVLATEAGGAIGSVGQGADAEVPKGIFTPPSGTTGSFTTNALWTEREAIYDNEVGYFVTDANGAVNGIAPGAAGYAQAALQSTSRKVLFAAGSGVGATGAATFNAHDFIVFYIIGDNTTEHFLSQNPGNHVGSGPLAYFSITAANPDNFEHCHYSASHSGGSVVTEFRWEDLVGGGDADFDDVVFTINVQPFGGSPNSNPNPNPTPFAVRQSASSAAAGASRGNALAKPFLDVLR